MKYEDKIKLWRWANTPESRGIIKIGHIFLWVKYNNCQLGNCELIFNINKIIRTFYWMKRKETVMVKVIIPNNCYMAICGSMECWAAGVICTEWSQGHNSLCWLQCKQNWMLYKILVLWSRSQGTTPINTKNIDLKPERL